LKLSGELRNCASLTDRRDEGLREVLLVQHAPQIRHQASMPGTETLPASVDIARGRVVRVGDQANAVAHVARARSGMSDAGKRWPRYDG
jgi:hypothetical protein